MYPKLSLGLAAATILLIGCAPGYHGAPSEERRLSLIQDPHIIEGEYVDIEVVPFQVSIELLTLHTCGGAIVSENYVVTAAHCLLQSLSGPTWLKRVRAGSTTEIPIIGWGGKTFGIAEALSHPQFDINTVDYDVGVIRVNGPFAFSKGIQSIPVPIESEKDFVDYSQSGFTSGWGLTSRQGLWSSLWLKKVTIPLIPHEQCVKLQEDQQVHVTPRMMCGGATGKGGPCHGDSGGPFVHKDKLIGLVSWGIKCNDDKLPSVFTNVLDPEIRSFIKEKTGV